MGLENVLVGAILAVIVTIEIGLGLYILSINVHSFVARLFFVFTLLAALGSIMDAVISWGVDQGTAILLARMAVFIMVIDYSIAYYLVALIPFDSRPRLMRAFLPLFIISVILMSLIAALSLNEIHRNDVGWFVYNNYTVAIVISMMLIIIALINLNLYYKIKLQGDRRMRKQCVIMSIASTIPAIYLIALGLLSAVGVRTPRIMGVAIILSIIILGYGVWRYGLLSRLPVIEKIDLHPEAKSVSFDLSKGLGYLFLDGNNETMYAHGLKVLGEGTPAMIFTRTYPDRLKESHGLERTPIIWLAEKPGPGRIDPSNMLLMEQLIGEFMRNTSALIMIDGLEYLIINNDYRKACQFLCRIKDEVFVRGGILVMSIDPRVLSEKEISGLEREFILIGEKHGAETAI